MSAIRILSFSFFPAFLPPQNGGVERLYRIYRGLSDRFDITLISSGDVNAGHEIVEHSPTFHEVRVPKDAAYIAAYQELKRLGSTGDISGPAHGISCEEFGPLHEAYLKYHSKADVIIHESPFLIACDMFRGFDGKPRIYNSYNFESGLYGSFNSTNSVAMPIEELVRQLEGELCSSADLITSCSDEDKAQFQACFSTGARFEIIPNGVLPPSDQKRSGKQSNRVIFVGSNHKPNNDAALFIANKLAPALPELHFEILGSCHPKFQAGNVTAHGVVDGETKRRLLGKAVAAINPITTGSGSSLKIPDFALHDLPIISTQLGMRGFGMEAGQHYLRLEKDEFVTGLLSLIADEQRLAKISAQAKMLVAERFTWASIVQRFGDRIEKLCEETPRAKSVLVLNDYDFLSTTGGGATRTAGLCRGLAETFKVIFLAFRDDKSLPFRELSDDGQILVLRVDKTDDHKAAHASGNALHWVSSADIVSYEYGPLNENLVNAFRSAAAASQHVVCEHPYMAGLPRLFGTEFVYSSQNYEAGLKSQALDSHPRRADLLEKVQEAERFSCGASSLIVAVSNEDAQLLGGNYRFTAPILVIRNGSDGFVEDAKATPKSASQPPIALFMGSAHMPNYEAAQWIVTELAPRHPDIEFQILGSVADILTKTTSANVKLIGQVSNQEKREKLCTASVALNPMSSGSGSNIKVADYLQHGLRVLSTSFGARGYEDVADQDLVIADLSAFGDALRNLAQSSETERSKKQRRKHFGKTLSMTEGGRRLARALEDHSGKRRRAIYVTYRYTNPPQGGGEYYVDRLIGSLARSGWYVDVAAPTTDQITDVDRFGTEFSGSDFQPVPVNLPRIRCAKFPADAEPLNRARSQKIWSVQPAYEEVFARSMINRPTGPALAWGWGYAQPDGRWMMKRSGIYASDLSTFSFAGHAPVPTWFQIFGEDGDLLYDEQVDGPFSIRIDIPAGLITIEAALLRPNETDDPRPLAVFANQIAVNGKILTGHSVHDNWLENGDPLEIYRAHSKAQKKARDTSNLTLTDARRPSKELSRFLTGYIGQYDLVVTHNAVFGTSCDAIEEAKKAGVPSILIPHLHLEDDFYHFQDVLTACRDASITFACPSSTHSFLKGEGHSNTIFLTPGIDSSEVFSDDDALQFRKTLGRSDPFILILGRKALAKGYRDVISSVHGLGNLAPLVVMIGPDDDKLPITEPGVVYLGPQPRSVLRGALRECLALVNMSRSESFGIVLLEAGLARKPVIANANCSAFSDLVNDGVNGHLTHVDGLSACVSNLINDPEARERMGQANFQFASKFDWLKIEKEFVRLCNQLVETSHAI